MPWNYDCDLPMVQHMRGYVAQEEARRRLRIALRNAAAAGDITREDRRVQYHTDDGTLTLDRIAYLCAGFVLGGLCVALLVGWWVR